MPDDASQNAPHSASPAADPQLHMSHNVPKCPNSTRAFAPSRPVETMSVPRRFHVGLRSVCGRFPTRQNPLPPAQPPLPPRLTFSTVPKTPEIFFHASQSEP